MRKLRGKDLKIAIIALVILGVLFSSTPNILLSAGEFTESNLLETGIELPIIESEAIVRTATEEELWEELVEAQANAPEDFPYDCPDFVEARNAYMTSEHGFYDEYGVWHQTFSEANVRRVNPRLRFTPVPGGVYDIDVNGVIVRTAFVNNWSRTGADATDGRVGFLQAFNTATIERIVMIYHVDTGSGTAGRTSQRTTGIEIYGGGYTLRFNAGARLILGNPGEANQQHLHIHNIFLGTHGTRALVSAGYEWALIAHNVGDGHINNAATPNWCFRLGNVATLAHNTRGNPNVCFLEHTGDSRIARVIRGNGSELTIYGDVLLNTNSENFYIGKVLVEDGARYIGHNHWRQYSTVWFIGNGSNNAFPPTSTSARTGTGNLSGIYGEDGNPITDGSFSFLIGRGAHVRLSGNGSVGGSATGYPMIYENYRRIVVGVDATFEVSSRITAGVAFSRNGQGFIANPGSFVNLVTLNMSSPVVSTTTIGWRGAGTGQGLIPGQPGGGTVYGSINTSGLIGCYFIMQEDSQLFVRGRNSGTNEFLGGIIHMPGGSATHPNRFEMHSPKRFDLTNINDARRSAAAAGANAPIFSRHDNFNVEITNTDIILWETGGVYHRVPDLIFLDEESFTFEGRARNYTTVKNPRLQYLLRLPGRWSTAFNAALHQHQRPAGLTGSPTMGLNNYRRMTAINASPVFRYDFTSRYQVTDADHTIRGHVLIGYVPRNHGIGEIGGGIIWEGVFAGPGQGVVWMTDSHDITFGPVRFIASTCTEANCVCPPPPILGGCEPLLFPSDEQLAGARTVEGGAITINTTLNTQAPHRPEHLQRAHHQDISTISAIFVEGFYRINHEPETTPVIDVTPPQPAEVTSGSVTVTTTGITGTFGLGDFLFNDITLAIYINGVAVPPSTLTVDSVAGTFALDTSAPTIVLQEGDVIDIVLNDNWVFYPVDLLPNPSTNPLGQTGNRNPIGAAITYRDTSFPRATRLIVGPDLGQIILHVPTHLNFGEHPVLWEDRMIPVQTVTGDELGVTDTRLTKIEWRVFVSMPLAGGLNHPSGANVLLQHRLGPTTTSIIPGGGNVLVYGPHTHPSAVEWHSIWGTWYIGATGNGLFANVPEGTVQIGTYSGTLDWTLFNGPMP